MSLTASILKAIFDHPLVADATIASPTTAPTATPTAIGSAKPTVDVGKIMNALAVSRGEHLDWKRSIVDLLKTVGLDSSHEARVRLAQELHYQGSVKDSATMNEFLHDAVLKAIESNGGKLPDSLK